MNFKSWHEFENLLYKLSKQPGYKPKKGEMKNGSPLISPAIFKAGDLRRNVNVQCWGGWAALDVDDYEGDYRDAINVFSKYSHVCYSSASSTEEKPKFRVILPIQEHIKAEDIRHFWYALNKEFNSLGDPQTKDLSRMYYVPAQYPNSFHFIESNVGASLDSYSLMNKHPFVQSSKTSGLLGNLPDHIRDKILEYRKESLNNTNVQWSSYRDCPFVNRDSVSQYFTIQNGGWYKQMYSIMLGIASKAVRTGYPISPGQIASLCREIDAETGNWYKNRNMEVEASRAIEYVLGNM